MNEPPAISNIMTVTEIERPGGPEVLKLSTRPIPRLKPGEILIKVAAAGVNRPDVFQRQGLYPPPRGASDIPGLEISGVVQALGEGATSHNIGDSVMALVTGGGYAEYCVASSALALGIPDGLSMIEAAAVPETFFTVWTNVFDRAHLLPGESLLVHGGAGGIGTTAIQMASALGSGVLATAGSDEKCQACLDLGAALAINYNTHDFVAAAKSWGDGKGVDVILDMVGGDYLERNIKALAPDGRLVNIAYLRGARAEVNFMPVMLKRLTITGSTLRSQPDNAKMAIAKDLSSKIFPLLETGDIRPVIHATFPLAEAADAHELMESNVHIGKIILIP